MLDKMEDLESRVEWVIIIRTDQKVLYDRVVTVQ